MAETRRPPSIWRELAGLGLKIAAIVAAFGLVVSFVFGLARNSDADMVPAVHDGDIVVFYRLDKAYAVGDLIVLDAGSGRQAPQIRRVVAVAGDTVDITAAGLVVNGSVQEEAAIYQPTRRYDSPVTFPLTVGAGQVFVLGDARNNATDSRVYGAVDIHDTLGTVVTVIRRWGF